jgi:hypothetical protein
MHARVLHASGGRGKESEDARTSNVGASGEKVCYGIE